MSVQVVPNHSLGGPPASDSQMSQSLPNVCEIGDTIPVRQLGSDCRLSGGGAEGHTKGVRVLRWSLTRELYVKAVGTLVELQFSIAA